MKAKTFVVLLGVLCVLAAAAYFMVQKDKPSREQALLGQKLFENLSVESINTIEVHSEEGSVGLAQGDHFWEVTDRFSHQADFNKISDLVKKIKAAKIGRQFDASDEVLARLSMIAPDQPEIPPKQKGIRIVFKDKSGQVLEDFVIGSDATRISTFYIKRTADSVISLVDQTFQLLDKKPEEWLMKDVINIDEKEVALVVCFDMASKKKIFMLERPEKSKKPILLNAPPEKKVLDYKLEQVIGALSPFKIDDVADPASPPAETVFSNQPQFEFRLFDGIIYHVYPGTKVSQDSDKYFFKVAVSYNESARKTERDGKEKTEDMAAKAEELNRKLSKWTYIVSKWVFDSFATKVEDFFEKEEQNDKKT